MNSLHIIGNLTADPELRTTTAGQEVCSFTVAVNRRKTHKNPDPGADYFRVSAWGEKGKICKQYLSSGKKVSVVGSVSVRAYTNSKGEPVGQLEVKAEDVEFLTPAGQTEQQPQTPPADQAAGFTAVETDELPF